MTKKALITRPMQNACILQGHNMKVKRKGIIFNKEIESDTEFVPEKLDSHAKALFYDWFGQYPLPLP